MAEVSPRTEADARIAGAMQVVVDAGGEGGRRDYTSDELDVLFSSLAMAADRLRKVPGGEEAHARTELGAATQLGQLSGKERASLDDALDRLGVPRHTPPGEPVSPGQPLCTESRILWLGAERDRLRHPSRDNHRRVMRVVTVTRDELSADELAREHQLRSDAPGKYEVPRWEDSEAVKIVKRTFGDDVDLSDGTVGDGLVKMVAAEIDHLGRLRRQLLAIASTLRQPED